MLKYAITIALFAHPVFAQEAPKCFTSSDVHETLRQKYKETPIVALIRNDGTALEVWGNLNGENWTVILTRPDGISCVVDSGGRWLLSNALSGDKV